MKKQNNLIYTVLEVILLVFFCVFLFLILKKTPNTDQSIEEIQEPVIASMQDENIKKAADLDIRRVFGLNENDYDGICYYQPSGELDVCEVLIVKLKSDSEDMDADAQTVEDAMQSRLDSQIQNFDGYGTNQSSILANAIIDYRGGCVIYIVSADPQKTDEAFRKAL